MFSQTQKYGHAADWIPRSDRWFVAGAESPATNYSVESEGYSRRITYRCRINSWFGIPLIRSFEFRRAKLPWVSSARFVHFVIWAFNYFAMSSKTNLPFVTENASLKSSIVSGSSSFPSLPSPKPTSYERCTVLSASTFSFRWVFYYSYSDGIDVYNFILLIAVDLPGAVWTRIRRSLRIYKIPAQKWVSVDRLILCDIEYYSFMVYFVRRL